MARLIVFIIFGGFGVVLLVVGIREFVAQRRLLAAARPIDAEILRSEVRSSRSSDTDRRTLRDNSTTSHTADVLFRYELDGRTYESELLRPSIIVRGHASAEGAMDELRPFPVGATVTAHVDPSQPDKAFLVAEKSMGPIVFIIIGVLLPPIAWFAGKLV